MLVTCAGILLVDIITANLSKISEPGELTFTPKGIEIHIGGHAGNVAVDLRKMGLEEGCVSSIGSVGGDVFGDYIEGFLKERGIVTHLQRVSSYGTSKDVVLVVKGEDRRFHVDVGANRVLDKDYVIRILEKEKPKIFYVGGVGLTGRFDYQLKDVLRKARETDCLTVVDPVTPYKHGWDFIIPSLRWINVFHCNHSEAKQITGEDDLLKSAKFFINKGTEFVIISLGEQGIVAATKDLSLRASAFKVEVIDPTGAGDALCAGIIHALIRTDISKKGTLEDLSTKEMTQVILEGEAAGAACVTRIGTTTGVTKENISRILKKQSSEILKRGIHIHTLS